MVVVVALKNFPHTKTLKRNGDTIEGVSYERAIIIFHCGETHVGFLFNFFLSFCNSIKKAFVARGCLQSNDVLAIMPLKMFVYFP